MLVYLEMFSFYLTELLLAHLSALCCVFLKQEY